MKVFSKEKFKETQGITEAELRKHEWASRCDGKTVEELKKMPYIISKDWLVEEEDYRKGKDNMEFKKDDLKNGDIVTLRNGDRLVFVGSEDFIDLSDDNDNCLSDICDLEDDFTHESYEDSDIVKIERPVEYTTVFKREEVKEMTVEEISKALGRGKHTTRHVELIELYHGKVLDTPGFSSIDFSDMDNLDIRNSFIEFPKYNCPYHQRHYSSYKLI